MLSMTILLVEKLDHALVEPTVAHGLDEVFLAERLHAFQQRRPDQPLLIGAVTAIARAGAPGAKAVHGVGIDLVAVDHRVQLAVAAAGGFVLCSDGARLARSACAPNSNATACRCREISHGCPISGNGAGDMTSQSAGRAASFNGSAAKQKSPAWRMPRRRCSNTVPATTAEARIRSANRPARCKSRSSL